MTDNTIPDYAERIDLFVVYRTRKQPSQFAPGVAAIVAYLECPVCHTEHEHPGGLISVKCQCGLFMQSTGSGFSIWREPAPAKVE